MIKDCIGALQALLDKANTGKMTESEAVNSALAVLEAKPAGSIEEKLARIRTALCERYGTENTPYIYATWPDYVIIKNWKTEEYTKVAYTDSADKITLGVSTPVTRTETFGEVSTKEAIYLADKTAHILEAAEDAQTATSDALQEGAERLQEAEEERGSETGRILESLDATGTKWRMINIEEGLSINRRRWTRPVLEKLVTIGNTKGAKSFNGHRPMSEKAISSVKEMLGFFDNFALESVKKDDGRTTVNAVCSDFTILDNAEWLKKGMMTAHRSNKKNLYGASIDALARASVKRTSEGYEQLVEDVFDTPEPSYDIVAYASAGGRALRVLQAQGGEDMNKAELLEAIRKGEATVSQITEGIKSELVSTAEVNEANKDLASIVPAPETQGGGNGGTATGTETVPATEAQIKEIVDAHIAPIRCAEVLRSGLAEANLPERVKESIKKRFDGKVFTTDELTAEIKESQELWADMTPTGRVTGHGAAAVKVTQEAVDKQQLALDGYFAGGDQKDKDGNEQPRFKSFRKAYETITGKYGMEPEDILKESVCFDYMDAKTGAVSRLSESVTTTTFAQMLGDSITRRLIAEYSIPALAEWRKVVSSVVAVNDFREQKRYRMGGYGTLPAVAQQGTYQSLTTPGDEEATYTISKRGGLEDLTIEAIANDDQNMIATIPRRLARAAARTLYKTIFDIFVNNAVVTYDSVALFDSSSHGNLGATALSATEAGVVRRILRERTAYGDSSEVLGADLKYILVPAELEDLAFKLCSSAIIVGATNNAGTEPNINAKLGLDYIVIPYWTDPTDWVGVANPADVPTIEVGFYKGNEEPELFVQDNPLMGSMFTADKVTYKIRHIYGWTVLDHRGMYKEVVT